MADGSAVAVCSGPPGIVPVHGIPLRDSVEYKLLTYGKAAIVF